MLKNSLRALCAASLIVAPLIAASPAHAVITCTVNGMPVSGTTINGTSSSDSIRCPSVPAGHTVNGLGGSDSIVINGSVFGSVFGGDGGDSVTVTQSGSVDATGVVDGQAGTDSLSIRGPVAGLVAGGDASDSIMVTSTVTLDGRVNGGAGDDYLQVAVNRGIVDGGTHVNGDYCRVGVGNPPINCENSF